MKGAASALKNLLSGVSSGSGHRFSFSFWVLKLLLSCPVCERGQGDTAGEAPGAWL